MCILITDLLEILLNNSVCGEDFYQVIQMLLICSLRKMEGAHGRRVPGAFMALRIYEYYLSLGTSVAMSNRGNVFSCNKHSWIYVLWKPLWRSFSSWHLWFSVGVWLHLFSVAQFNWEVLYTWFLQLCLLSLLATTQRNRQFFAKM